MAFERGRWRAFVFAKSTAQVAGVEHTGDNGGGGFRVRRGTQFPCVFGRPTGWDRAYARCRAQPSHRRALERPRRLQRRRATAAGVLERGAASTDLSGRSERKGTTAVLTVITRGKAVGSGEVRSAVISPSIPPELRKTTTRLRRLDGSRRRLLVGGDEGVSCASSRHGG